MDNNNNKRAQKDNNKINNAGQTGKINNKNCILNKLIYNLIK